jgi:hypothetical protein
MKLVLALVLAGMSIRYPGLIAPAAIAVALWSGMVGLARVHPTAATLVYCFVCGCMGLRPWRHW